MKAPAWVTGEAPDPVEVASEKMQTDLAAERLRTRSVGHLPLDRDSAERELAEGERALRASRPRTRRWRALDKFDREIDGLTQRHVEANARLQEAEEALTRAPEDDARSLADWLARGEKGARPAATVYERERERDAARLLVEAAVIEVDRAIERRVEHVERHRGKMLEEARRDVDDARARLLAHVHGLPALRRELLNARETLEWVAAFPEQPRSFGFPTATALGLRRPVEKTLGTAARVEYAAVLQALEEDAAALAEEFSADLKRQLGTAVPPTPFDQAMWDADIDPAWKRAQLERARELAMWSTNPHQVAAEASDYRPDPPAA